MATYYSRNVTGNWDSNTSWDSVSSGGAGPAGPPVAGDTAIFDSGFTGNITVAATAACTVLTCQAGATGTLTWGSGITLTVAGNVTFVSGFNLSGTTGTLAQSVNADLTTGGLQIPGNYTVSGSRSIALKAALDVAGTITFNGATTAFTGAFDATCSYLCFGSNQISAMTLTLVAGQTITVSTGLLLGAGGFSSCTIKSSTASSDTFLHYNGTAAKCKVAGVTFTDINCAHPIDNWYGGTLTRTTGITNRTSADIGGGTGGGKIFIDGAWRTISSILMMIGGAWKQISGS
jgi:hypothetical protein